MESKNVHVLNVMILLERVQVKHVRRGKMLKHAVHLLKHVMILDVPMISAYVNTINGVYTVTMEMTAVTGKVVIPRKFGL
jgi:hypothetical protein